MRERVKYKCLYYNHAWKRLLLQFVLSSTRGQHTSCVSPPSALLYSFCFSLFFLMSGIFLIDCFRCFLTLTHIHTLVHIFCSILSWLSIIYYYLIKNYLSLVCYLFFTYFFLFIDMFSCLLLLLLSLLIVHVNHLIS